MAWVRCIFVGRAVPSSIIAFINPYKSCVLTSALTWWHEAGRADAAYDRLHGQIGCGGTAEGRGGRSRHVSSDRERGRMLY